MIPSLGAPPLADVVTEMLGHLETRMPGGPGAPVPDPSVSVVSLSEKALGLGNRRGNEGRDRLPLVALKGGHLDAEVRFQLWGDGPGQVDGAFGTLRQNLLTDQDALRSAGFLLLDGTGATPAEPFPDPGGWRGTADYRVLYEYRYAETEGAEGLIARIAVDLDGSAFSVTDHMALWDKHGAADLEVRRGGRRSLTLGGLYVVSFLPAGWDGAQLQVRSRAEGVIRQRTFADVRTFVAEVVPDGDPLELGAKTFHAGRIELPTPLTLSRGSDFFRISYAEPRLNDAGADTEAALYLRAIA